MSLVRTLGCQREGSCLQSAKGSQVRTPAAAAASDRQGVRESSVDDDRLVDRSAVSILITFSGCRRHAVAGPPWMPKPGRRDEDMNREPKARLDRARRLAQRMKVGALVAALVAFVGAVPLVRATYRSQPRRTHPLKAPADFVAVISANNFGAGDLAPGQAPPVVSSGGS